jgi:hypothetical protein
MSETSVMERRNSLSIVVPDLLTSVRALVLTRGVKKVGVE